MPLARIGPYLRPYRLRISLILGALTISALTTLSIGPGVGILVDSGLLSGEGVGQLPVAIAVMLTLALVLAISTWVRYYNVSWLGERVSADLREKVFSHLVDLHPGFFESERSGDLQSRFTTDTTVLQSVVGSSVSIVLRNLVMCFGGILTLFWLNPRLATAVLLVIPALVLPVLVMARRVKRLSRTTQDRVGVVGRELSEVTRHIKTVQGVQPPELPPQKVPPRGGRLLPGGNQHDPPALLDRRCGDLSVHEFAGPAGGAGQQRGDRGAQHRRRPDRLHIHRLHGGRCSRHDQ